MAQPPASARCGRGPARRLRRLVEGEGPPDLLFVSTRDGDYAIFGADAQGKHSPAADEGEGRSVDRRPGSSSSSSRRGRPTARRSRSSSKRDGTSHIYVMQRRRHGDAPPDRARRRTTTARPGRPTARQIVFGARGGAVRRSGGRAVTRGASAGAWGTPPTPRGRPTAS